MTKEEAQTRAREIVNSMRDPLDQLTTNPSHWIFVITQALLEASQPGSPVSDEEQDRICRLWIEDNINLKTSSTNQLLCITIGFQAGFRKAMEMNAKIPDVKLFDKVELRDVTPDDIKELNHETYKQYLKDKWPSEEDVQEGTAQADCYTMERCIGFSKAVAWLRERLLK